LKKNTKIKILIADTQYLIREGLRNLISRQPRFEYAGEVTSSAELTSALTTTQPDVLIIDHCCDECFSADQIKKVKSRFPELNILVISSEKKLDEIKKIIALGIKNYLLKECDAHEITEAIEACANGKKYFCGQIVDALLEKELSPELHCETGTITEREQEIILLTVKGLRTKEIADKLFLSPYTVSTHKKNIFRKLGINGSLELTNYAFKTGLLKST
jgi:DNA-binding NarL/FixJ family response regulator